MCHNCLSISRREFLKISSLLTVAGALPLINMQRARAAEEPDAPVRIGYLPITDAAPLLVAHANGLFDQQGIKAERPVMLRSWSQVIEAFISGQVNVIHLLSPMTIWARFGAQVPAQVVAWNHTNGSALTVAPSINKVEDLAGKTLAIPFWYSIHNVVVQQILRQHGLEPVTRNAQGKQVNLVVMSPADMPPALASQRIQGYIVAEPFNALAEANSIGKVLRFTGDIWKNHACCVVFMHSQDLQQRPEWSQKVVNALVNAQLWIRDNRAETAALLAKSAANRYTPHTESILKQVLAPETQAWQNYTTDGAIIHPDWEEKRIDFQPYPYPSYSEQLIEQLKHTLIQGDNAFLSALNAKQATQQLVNDTFVRNSIAAVGGMSRFGQPDSFSREEIIRL
ncbi:ABC transporter substrate-binding protein [[Pantoea] beijingensis]|uniref:ABC transporter substrate-binding protein n=1 Tax=[Pantoea] beijingensis TaxID=1324864 RepID=A0A443IHX0_9GAMM|nr:MULTISPECIES: ABC transporter substrate-binding protein [Erwiniaceae]RWR03620.1 ABC transporter substrate-binding protein [[Pantoea] beijingensis]